jgi:hypothetical protein
MECHERIDNSARMTATVVLVAAGFMNRIESVLSKCPAIPSRLEAHASLLLIRQPPTAIRHVSIDNGFGGVHISP